MTGEELEIRNNIGRIKATLPDSVRLVAVSKFNPIERVMAAYNAGQRLFGESHAQELVPKAEALPKDIKWHFIGHLQTNKVKYIVPIADCIESVDSLKLLKEINKQAQKCGRYIKCLLQFHIAKEETKFGFSLEECEQMLESQDIKELSNVVFAGVMGMASAVDDENQVLKEFGELSGIFSKLKNSYFKDNPDFREISMGMTHDYPLAVKQGATLVRVGSGIFGERMYANR